MQVTAGLPTVLVPAARLRPRPWEEYSPSSHVTLTSTLKMHLFCIDTSIKRELYGLKSLCVLNAIMSLHIQNDISFNQCSNSER